MLVATWNVNSLKARMPRVLQFLAEHRPDVVCLQGIRGDAGAFPFAELSAAGYDAVERADPLAGVAQLSRRDVTLTDVVTSLDSSEQAGRWIEASTGSLRVVSIDAPVNGTATFLAAVVERVTSLVTSPLIVTGTFNVAPGELDTADPAVPAAAEPVRAPFRSLLALGLHDTFREMHGDAPGFTWSAPGRFLRKRGVRVDLTLVSGHLAGRVRRAAVDRNYRKGPRPSDHVPLLLELAD